MDLDAVNATMDDGMEEFTLAREKVNQCLVAYKRECRQLIEEIGSGNRSDAEGKFDILFLITGRLSKAWFVLDINIGADLEIAVHEFERLHEPHTRDYWFKRFQAGERWPT